jgi:two-component system, response regulator PdtaR
LKRTVLVIEDHFITRWGASEYLRHVGYRVVEAVNVPEAKGILDSGMPIDVVFSDINMPGGEDGYVLAQWLATHHPNLPVLLTSGEPEDSAAYTQGALRQFVQKPYEPAGVDRILRTMLNGGLNGGECGPK